MISVHAAIDHAFSETGPVHRLKGEHRPLQHEFACRFGGYLETGNLPWIQEARAGVGKTLPLLIGLMLDKILNDRNGIVSTLTRALRETYIAETDIATRIVRETLHDLGLDEQFRLVSVAEFKSTTSYLSPTKIRSVGQRWGEASTLQRRLVEFFLDTAKQGEVPEFTEYYGSGGVLPTNTTELDWCLCAADRNHPVAEAIFSGRQTARDNAAILLVTHALFIRNNIRSGKMLQTGPDWNTRNGCAVIDEADKLPPVAADALTYSISRNGIATLAQLERVSTSSMLTYTNAREQIHIGLNAFTDEIKFDETGFLIRSEDIIDNSDGPILKALQAIYEGLQSLQFIASGQFNRDDTDVIQHDIIRREREEIRAILAGQNYTPARVAQSVKFDREGDPDLEVTVNFSSGRGMMNQLWRSSVHSYNGVALISATLSDRPPSDRSYHKFLRAIGIDPLIDQLIQEKPLPSSRRDQYGSIAHVLVVDRDLTLYPIDNSQSNFNSAAFVNFVARAILEIVKLQTPDQRMLVLFQQYALLEAVWAQVPSLHSLIIKRQRGSNMPTSLGAYAARPGGIWFGVEWEGVNFVSEEGKTLADIVVIPRIPQPPINIMRRSRLSFAFDGTQTVQLAEGIALNEAVDFAYQRMVQGIARGTRHAHDVIQLLAILDVRFPVPPHVSDTRLIARSIGDSGKLFHSFDQMLDPFNVRQWSQIDKDAVITSILDDRPWFEPS